MLDAKKEFAVPTASARKRRSPSRNCSAGRRYKLRRSKSSAAYHTKRPQDDVRADANYFLSSVLGADHSMKFGFAVPASLMPHVASATN